MSVLRWGPKEEEGRQAGEEERSQHLINHTKLLVHFNIVVYAFCFWLTQPILPYLSKDLGANPIIFGYLQTFFALAQLVGGPLMGRLIDSKGAKTGLILTQAASGCSYLLLGLAYNLPILFLSRLPTVLMHCMQAAQTAITDLSDENTRAASLGKLSLSYGIGFLLGPALGGLANQYFGHSFVAFVAASISFLLPIINFSLLPETRKIFTQNNNNMRNDNENNIADNNTHNNNNNSTLNTPPAAIIRNKESLESTKNPGIIKAPSSGMNFAVILQIIRFNQRVRNVLVLKIIVGLGFATFHSNFSLTAQEHFKLNSQDVGLILSYIGLLSILCNSFFIGWLTKRFSEFTIVKVALLVLVAEFLDYARAESYWHLMAILPFLSVSSSSLYTVVTSVLTKSVAQNDVGTILGLDHATRSFCSVLAPTLGGYLFQYYGHASIGLFGSVVTAMALIAGTFLLADAQQAQKNN